MPVDHPPLPPAFANALVTLPRRPGWVVGGSVALMLQLGSAHRSASDIDIVTVAQRDFARALLAGGAVPSVSPLRFHHHGVVVELMDLFTFAGAGPTVGALHTAMRHFLFESRSSLTVMDVGSGTRRRVPVASVAGIAAMKAVALESRRRTVPAKTAHDIIDLVYLTRLHGPSMIAAELAHAPRRLAHGVARVLMWHFASMTGQETAVNRCRQFLTRDDLDGIHLVEELGQRIAGRCGSS